MLNDGAHVHALLCRFPDGNEVFGFFFMYVELSLLDLGNGMGKEWKDEAGTMACDTELLREPHGICSMECWVRRE